MNDRHHERIRAVAGPVSRETLERLDRFAERFLEWNSRINLVAASTINDLWERHIVDSAQILPLLGRRRTIADIGSGGGFPGLVLAILMAETDGARLHLIESNRKKTAFLTTITGVFGLPVTVHPVRIEDSYATVGPVEAVTARALTDLPNLVELSLPWLRNGATGFFHKGRDFQREILDCRTRFTMDVIVHESRTRDGGVILEITDPAPAGPGR